MPPFRNSLRLPSIYGFKLRVHWSWLILLSLLVYGLGGPSGLFRQSVDGLSPALAWLMGLIGALALVAALVVHELCHSIVAREIGVPVEGITLFIFGGVSELSEEPPTPGGEFLMAVAGPAASVALGVGFVALAIAAPSMGMPAVVLVLVKYLAVINILLAIFNSIPAFPLDGGRVLRSILWGVSGDLYWATRWAARIGGWLGALLIGLGLFLIASGAGLQGVWIGLIGFLVRRGAMGNLQQLMVRLALEGELVAQMISRPPVTVPEGLDLEGFVEDYVLPCRQAVFPVTDTFGRLVGLVEAGAPSRADHHVWADVRVRDLMSDPPDEMLIPPDAPAGEALRRLGRSDGDFLIVMHDTRPVGLLRMEDLIGFVRLKGVLRLGTGWRDMRRHLGSG